MLGNGERGGEDGEMGKWGYSWRVYACPESHNVRAWMMVGSSLEPSRNSSNVSWLSLF